MSKEKEYLNSCGMTKEVKSYIEACIYDLNLYQKDSIIMLFENGDLNKLNGAVTKVYRKYFEFAFIDGTTNENKDISCKQIAVNRFNLQQSIRDVLYEIYENYASGGEIAEWKPNLGRVEDAMKQVQEILDTYERGSTDWYKVAADKVKALNDPIASALFTWAMI